MQQTFAGQGRTGSRGNQNCRDLNQDLEIPSAGVFFQPKQLFVLPRCGHCPWHGGTGQQDGHGGDISMPGGTAVLWLRAPGDCSQRHKQSGRLVLGRLDRLGTCRFQGGAVLGGCWGTGLPSKYWEPAWVHEKRGSGGSTSWSLQPKGCQGSQMGPADNVARLPLASPQLQGRGCSVTIWPCRVPCIPSPSALLLLAGRKQLTRSHLELLTHCCLACCSLVPSARAGKAPWLPLGRWFGTRSLLQASPPWGPGAPPGTSHPSHVISHSHSCKGWMLALSSLSVERRS